MNPTLKLATFADATGLAASFARRETEVSMLLALLDDRHAVVDLLALQMSEAELPEIFAALPNRSVVHEAVLITRRPPVYPADRPDDELVWQELVDTAAAKGIVLRDWIVVAGQRWAWSVAEFAPTPARWS